MGRPLRIEYAGALYHITSRGNERQAIFREDADRRHFLSLLAEYHERSAVLLHSYVLMGNHYHLLLETPRGNLVQVMQGINGRYTRYFNQQYRRVGHLFQGRYRGIVVEKERYLLELSRYMHLNPVRAKIVARPEEYAWSSYRGYIGKQPEERWVEYGWVLSQFGRRKGAARRQYRIFIEAGLEGSLADPFQAVYGQVVLGGEAFQEEIKTYVDPHQLGQEILARKRFHKTPDLDVIVQEVARSFGVSAEELRRKGSRANRARQVAVYLAKRYSGLGNGEIGTFFGGLQGSAVSKAAARLESACKEDQVLARQVSKLQSTVKA